MAIRNARNDVESGKGYLRYAAQESTVVRSIREAEKEADRVETSISMELLLADLISGKLHHPDLAYNATLLKKLDVYASRSGGFCTVPTSQEVEEHYRRCLSGPSDASHVLRTDLKLEDETATIDELAAEGALDLAPDTVLVNGTKGPTEYPVEYGRAKVSGEFVPVGMITVSESVYDRNGAQYGSTSKFSSLPYGITLVIRVKVRIQGTDMLAHPYPDGKQLINEIKRCQAKLRSPASVEEVDFSLALSGFWQY